ncbi:MAG TPA: hypothetical protein VMT03_17755 [Polyangia bacterium]|nr:hypothetical protein [Polyangia bacterium]
MTAPLTLPENLPSIPNAKLPAAYEAAREALEACTRLDECQDWADKSAALASYAKQSEDPTLEDHATRIRARAIRRCGELLREIQPSKGGRPADETRTGNDTSFTRTQAATDAGLSKRQKDTALRVAAVPQAEFDVLVDGKDRPAKVTELARAGTKAARKPVVDLAGRSPDDYRAMVQAFGTIKEFARYIEKADLDAAVRGCSEDDLADLAEQIPTVITRLSGWLGKINARTGHAVPPAPPVVATPPATVAAGQGSRVAAVRRVLNDAMELFLRVDFTGALREATSSDLAALGSELPVAARTLAHWADEADAARKRAPAEPA